MDIYEKSKAISTQAEFALFLHALKEDLDNNPDEWENNNLSSFFQGMEGYCLDKKQEGFSWSIFAEMLLAARVYE